MKEQILKGLIALAGLILGLSLIFNIYGIAQLEPNGLRGIEATLDIIGLLLCKIAFPK